MPLADLSPTASNSIEYEFPPVAAANAVDVKPAAVIAAEFMPPVPPVNTAEAVVAAVPLTLIVISLPRSIP